MSKVTVKKKGSAKKSGTGTTTVQKKGEAAEETSETVVAGPFEGPTANVNVSLGARIGLPNYSDVRVGCSLTIPVEATPEEIEAGFVRVEAWCFEKIDLLTEKALTTDG